MKKCVENIRDIRERKEKLEIGIIRIMVKMGKVSKLFKLEQAGLSWGSVQAETVRLQRQIEPFSKHP